MTSSGSINNQYSNYDNVNTYGTASTTANFNNNSNSPSEDLSYFQGYQGLNTDRFTSNSGLYRPESYSSQSLPKQPLNDATALARVQVIANDLDKQSTGQTDGNIGLEDFKQALADDSGKYSEKDKEAIQYLIDNQNGMRGRLDSFDGKGDALITVDSINKLVANPNAQPEKTAEQKMTNTEALQIYKGFLMSHMQKGMTREQMSSLVSSDKLNEQEKTAFNKLLNNEEFFKAADTGRDNNGDYDGHISIKDATKLINRSDVDKIGVNSGNSSTGGSSGQPVVQGGMNSYPPVSTGNSNLDYYYNNVYGNVVGPATDVYRQAPGGQQQAA